MSGGSWEREGVSLVRRVCPHALRGGTSADDSGRFAIIAAVLGGLWWSYLCREWQARVFWRRSLTRK